MKEKNEINCPRCNEKMAKTNSSGINTHTCLYCRGAWLNKNSLTQLLSKESDAPNIGDIIESFHTQNEGGTARHCPGCENTQLEIIHAHNIELDLCPKCNGLFFDEGELKAVLPDSHMPENKMGFGTYAASEGLFWILIGFFT